MFDSYSFKNGASSLMAEPVVTRAARLLPVLRGGEPAMLKLSIEEGERLGGAIMEWWDGDGAARVLAREENALLLERATGLASLSGMARMGRDDEACRILCLTAARLHAPRAKALPKLTPLAQWFRDLAPAARTHGGILSRCAETAETLIHDQREIVVLHGDLHHDNVLDFGERGWLAIDPKHIIGERGFDFANIFTNPDLADPTRSVAIEPGASHGGWKLLQKPRSSIGFACFPGFSPGLVYLQRGSWVTVIRWRRSICISLSSPRPKSTGCLSHGIVLTATCARVGCAHPKDWLWPRPSISQSCQVRDIPVITDALLPHGGRVAWREGISLTSTFQRQGETEMDQDRRSMIKGVGLGAGAALLAAGAQAQAQQAARGTPTNQRPLKGIDITNIVTASGLGLGVKTPRGVLDVAAVERDRKVGLPTKAIDVITGRGNA